MHVEEVGILHALLVFVAVALAAAGRPGGRAIDCLESLVLSRPGHTARTAQVAFCPVPAGAGAGRSIAKLVKNSLSFAGFRIVGALRTNHRARPDALFRR
jgi:hypothetical protein